LAHIETAALRRSIFGCYANRGRDQTVVPLDQVRRDFFGHLTMEKLLRKALRGEIALPIVRIETSQTQR
jgi:hypothetical protein